MHYRHSAFWIVLSILVLCAPVIWAQDGLKGALSRSKECARFMPALDEGVVAADFDNDEKADGAVLLEAGQVDGERAFRIEFHLTARQNATISFSSPETLLVISTLDVNRDGAPDIVVEKAFTHKRLQVYLNNGHGAFQRVSPEAFPAPDDSTPLLRAPVNGQVLPAPFMPATRGFEAAQSMAVSHISDAVQVRFWRDALIAQYGPRAPSGSRAPPFHLSL